jgi:hypothetical protein
MTRFSLNSVTVALPNREQVAPIAALCAFDIKEKESFEALPGLHAINRGILNLKGVVSDGKRGCSGKKVAAYLGYRVVSYLCIPLVLNLISLIVSTILTLLTLPLRCCNTSINRWCWCRLQGSLGYTLQSLHDFIGDFRLLTSCCCSGSMWAAI